MRQDGEGCDHSCPRGGCPSLGPLGTGQWLDDPSDRPNIELSILPCQPGQAERLLNKQL